MYFWKIDEQTYHSADAFCSAFSASWRSSWSRLIVSLSVSRRDSESLSFASCMFFLHVLYHVSDACTYGYMLSSWVRQVGLYCVITDTSNYTHVIEITHMLLKRISDCHSMFFFWVFYHVSDACPQVICVYVFTCCYVHMLSCWLWSGLFSIVCDHKQTNFTPTQHLTVDCYWKRLVSNVIAIHILLSIFAPLPQAFCSSPRLRQWEHDEPSSARDACLHSVLQRNTRKLRVRHTSELAVSLWGKIHKHMGNLRNHK